MTDRDLESADAWMERIGGVRLAEALRDAPLTTLLRDAYLQGWHAAMDARDREETCENCGAGRLGRTCDACGHVNDDEKETDR